MNVDSKRVMWLANVASPYRRPVWEALGEMCRLQVALLENDEQLARDGRRGSDWTRAKGRAYTIRRLPAWVVRRGEETHYTVRPGGLPRLRGVDAVLLGGWDSPAFWQVLALARLNRVRTVGFYESTRATNRFTSGPIAALRAWFFRRLDAVVVPGPASAAQLRSSGVDPKRIVVGFNAVDVRMFANGAARARADEGVRPPGHRFIYVGQLIARKNVDGLLQAFAAMRDPHDRLDLVGRGDDEPELRRAVERLGLQPAVRFLGVLPNSDLPALLAQQHTLVLPSHREVWGLVVNEALACGLQAVVAEDAGVTASILGMPGVFTTGTDVAAMTSALRAARSSWVGPIQDPPILAHTPEAFAATFAQALGISRPAGRPPA